MKRVVVTGMGIASPLGRDVDLAYNKLKKFLTNFNISTLVLPPRSKISLYPNTITAKF